MLLLLFFSQTLAASCSSKHDHILQGASLRNHVTRSYDVMDVEICEMLCFLDPNCVSLNFKKSESKCELN